MIIIIENYQWNDYVCEDLIRNKTKISSRYCYYGSSNEMSVFLFIFFFIEKRKSILIVILRSSSN